MPTGGTATPTATPKRDDRIRDNRWKRRMPILGPADCCFYHTSSIARYHSLLLLRAWLTLASLAPSDGHGDVGVVFLASLDSATPGVVPLALLTPVHGCVSPILSIHPPSVACRYS